MKIWGLLVFLGAMVQSHANSAELEVLHWWTSGGEAKSLKVLKDLLEKKQHTWKDFAVAGGSGSNAMTVLKSRVVSGNPPTAAQASGMGVREWGEMDVLANLDQLAKEEGWDNKIFPVVQQVARFGGHYVAAPVNIHRTNWMWVNKAIFHKVGVAVPKTWQEFAQVSEKIRKAGYIPLAHGGQDWQDATVFETIALGVGGAEFYRQAFVDLDPKVLGSQKMIEVFKIFRMVQGYTDRNAAGRDWNLATAMVIKGEAAMQIMGDWAKGEFKASGKVAGRDYLCAPVPQTAGKFSFNTDSFIMFEQKSKEKKNSQMDLARMILDPKFQEEFNLNKGSLPVRGDVSLARFDSCAKSAMEDFVEGSKNQGIVPSLAHSMAATADVKGAFLDVVTNFFNSKQAPEDAVKKLSKAVRLAH